MFFRQKRRRNTRRAPGDSTAPASGHSKNNSGPRSANKKAARRNAQWFLTNGTGVRLSGTNRMVTLFLESPEMADIHQDNLRRGITDYSPANDPLLEG